MGVHAKDIKMSNEIFTEISSSLTLNILYVVSTGTTQ